MTAGNGLCLSDHGDLLTPYKVVFFGPDFGPRHTESLPGVTSRARVSPDGNYGASTVFVTGDSYAPGSFSTRTSLWDMATGEQLVDLEQFSVFKDGEQIQSPDHNFWGVTFAQPAAAASTPRWAPQGTPTWCAATWQPSRSTSCGTGSSARRSPPTAPGSPSSSGSTPAIGPTEWQPAVLDVATLKDHPLAEARTIDDQIEWLDNSTVLYAVDTGIGAPDT